MKTQLKAFYRTQLNSVYKNSLSALRPAIAVPALVMSLAAPVYAQSNGALTGAVTNGDGTFFFEGARVIIPELGRETTTGRDGTYRLTNIPPGTYSIRVEYLGAEPMELSVTVDAGETSTSNIAFASQVEEVLLVVGSRAGLTSARNKERIADELKNVVASDGINAFPDQNVAESLQRLPGVSIERDAGEGRFVTVRGLRAEFTNVEIDGVKIGGGEGGDADSGGTSRAARLDTISADVLEGIEVTKTPTAEMEGDAVGATVALSTLSAFDRPGRAMRFRAEGSEQNIIEETNFKGTFSFSDIFEVGMGELGVAFAASYQERDIGRYQFNTNDPFYEAAVDVNGDTIIPGEGEATFVIPGEIQDVYRTNERERQGITLNIDYRTDKNHDYFIRYTTNETTQDNVRWRQRYELGDRVGDDDDIEFERPGNVTNLGPFSATIEGRGRIRKGVRYSSTKAETNVFSVGGINRFDNWTVDYKAGFSEVRDGNDRPSVLLRYRGGSFDEIAYRGGTSDGRIVSISEDALDPEEYELNSFTVSSEVNEDDIVVFEANAEWLFGDDNALKFGVKSTNRDRKNTGFSENIADEVAQRGILGNCLDVADDVNCDRDDSDEDEITNDDVLLTDLLALGVGLEAADLPRTPGEFRDLVDLGDIRSLLEPSRAELEQIARDNEAPGAGFDMEEDVLAAYVQLTYNFTDELRFVGGIRVEQTDFSSGPGIFDEEFEYSNNSAIPGDEQNPDTPVAVDGIESDYTDVLPRMMLRWEPRDDLILRVAYTTAVQRPDFDDVGPSADITTREIETGEEPNEVGTGTFSRSISNPGNSELEPSRSDQIDLYLTWYPSDDSVLQAGYFRKELDDFFATVSLQGSDVTAAGFEFNENNTIDGGFNEVQGVTLNADEAEIEGIELSYQQNFSWGGFVALSYTNIDSEAGYGELRPDERLPLIGQAENIGNATVGWENEQFTVRLSSSYSDDVFFRPFGSNTPDYDVYLKEATYTDLGLKYNINDNYTVYMDVINIFEEERIRFHKDLLEPWFSQVEELGRTWQIGVTGKF